MTRSKNAINCARFSTFVWSFTMASVEATFAAAPIPNMAKKRATRYGRIPTGVGSLMLGMKRTTATAVTKWARTRIRFRPKRSHRAPK